MPVRRLATRILALLAAAALSACAGDGGLQLQPPDAVQNAPSVGSLPRPAAANSIHQSGGSATELYSRIARGAMSCWFAVGGPLKKDYVYHASADAPSRGGKAEILIHQRDTTQPNPRGPKAFQVEIQPTGESSATITTENLKLSDAYARSVTDDVARWAKGEEGCTGSSTAAGWAPALPAEPVVAEEKPKMTKHKAKTAHGKAAAKPSAQAKAKTAPAAAPAQPVAQAKPSAQPAQ